MMVLILKNFSIGELNILKIFFYTCNQLVT